MCTGANLPRQKMNANVTRKIHVTSREMERSHVNWQIRPGQKNGVCAQATLKNGLGYMNYIYLHVAPIATDKNDLLGSKLAAILECRFLGNIYRVTAKYYRNSSYSYIPWLFPFSCAQQHLRSRSARPLGRNHSSSALFTPMPR